MRFSNLSTFVGSAFVAAAILIGAGGQSACAEPLVYDFSADYSGGGLSGTIEGTFDVDPSSGVCSGSPVVSCDYTDSGTFSTTGAIISSVVAQGLNASYEQFLWSFPNPAYPQETSIELSNGFEDIFVGLFPGFSDPSVLSVPTGTFSNPPSTLVGFLNDGIGDLPNLTSFTITAAPVPEPGTLAVLGASVAGLVAARRRRRA